MLRNVPGWQRSYFDFCRSECKKSPSTVRLKSCFRLINIFVSSLLIFPPEVYTCNVNKISRLISSFDSSFRLLPEIKNLEVMGDGPGGVLVIALGDGKALRYAPHAGHT